MKLDFSNERVLAVVAHPDDAELLCAGTLARARDDGAAVGVCVLCQGDKGQPAAEIADLAAVRQGEMTAAAGLLRARLFTAGIPDGTLTDCGENRGALIEIVRQFRPTLVLAHAGNDYHPDHRAASQLAEAVTWFCASRGHATASEPLGGPPALWWMDTVTAAGFEPDFYVDVSPHVALKEQMLDCHQSQLRREGDRDFAPLLDLMRRQMQFRGEQASVAAAEAFQTHRAFKRTRAW